MFSIHCKVLRVGRQKKEESILVQTGERGKQDAWVTRNPLLSLVCSPLKFSISQRKNKIKGLKWPECSTDWSCSQSTDHEKLVGVPGWKCLTLHHVVAGRFSREIFKGLQCEG